MRRTKLSIVMTALAASLMFVGACGDDDDAADCNNDGVCDPGEDNASCPADCQAAVCDNDGTCDTADGETAASCPADCGAACNNDGTCDAGETTANCPADCPAACNNDGTCDAGEDSTNCPADCSGLTGLGEECADPSTCPTEAPLCVGPPNGQAQCNAQCGTGVTIMTDGSTPPQITSITGQDDSLCVAAYSGGVGTPVCGSVLLGTGTLPASPNDIQPNTSYTADAVCVIVCGAGGACPTGLTCSGATQGVCQL